MNWQLHRLFGAGRHVGGEEENWLSVSDLMAGLMMVFLFVSIALMRHAFVERDRITEIAVTYRQGQVAIYEALMKEFRGDLEGWNAEIDAETLAFEFKAPDVLFETGETALKPRYREILDDFFPRYLAVLRPFERLDAGDSIEEVRIEGHTSSEWNVDSTPREAYFLNMALSQGRTRAVLNYVYGLTVGARDRSWVMANMAAVGYSSSRLVLGAGGKENKAASRRVVFRIVTNAETRIRKILGE